MIVKEPPIAFPWYEDRARQHRFRENCQGLLPYELLTPQEAMLPFQFRVLAGSVAPTVTDWDLYDACAINQVLGDPLTTQDFIDITDQNYNTLLTQGALGSSLVSLPSADKNLLEIHLKDGYYYIIYKGQALASLMACGFYEARIKLSDGSVLWSEVFRVTEKQNGRYPYMVLTWWNSCDLGKIVYSTGFKNKLYLDNYLSHSEPELFEEVEPDGMNTEQVTFSKITHKYKFSDVVPDYLKTALTAMSMHSSKNIIDKNYLVAFDISRMRVTAQIEGGGCLSFVDVLVEHDDIMVATACC